MKSTRNTLATVAVLLPLYACASGTPSESQTQAVIGANDLKNETNQELLGKIGELTDGQTHCSAFLTDTSEIATAAHCVESKKISTFSFRTMNSPLKYKVKVKNINSNIDIAVLSVEGKFRQKLEFGEVREDKIKLVGYDTQKKTLVTHENCDVSRDFSRPGILSHTCDSFQGMSGGVLLQQGRVVGIHLGSLKNQKTNVALEAKFTKDQNLKINRQEITAEAWGLGKCVPWCPGDEGKIIPPIPPLTLPGMNPAWSGFLMGGPLGLLINDKLATERKIKEMREAGAQREADFLELKSQLFEMAKERDNLKNQLSCAAAKSGFIPGLDALYNGFVATLENADSEQASRDAWENYQTGTEALLNAAKGTCK
jgi:V8-like Glu-specific endopeptidase